MHVGFLRIESQADPFATFVIRYIHIIIDIYRTIDKQTNKKRTKVTSCAKAILMRRR